MLCQQRESDHLSLLGTGLGPLQWRRSGKAPSPHHHRFRWKARAEKFACAVIDDFFELLLVVLSRTAHDELEFPGMTISENLSQGAGPPVSDADLLAARLVP